MKTKLKEYRVYASETVYYEYTVKAREAGEALVKAHGYTPTQKDIRNSDNFEADVELIKD